jgi:hypothetical protein
MSGIRRIPYSRKEFFKVSDHLLDLHHKGSPLRYTVMVDGLEVVSETDDPNELEEVRRMAEEEPGTKVIVIAVKGRGRSVQKTVFFIRKNLNAEERRAFLGDDPELMELERRDIVQREEKRIEGEVRLRTLMQELEAKEGECRRLEAYCLHLEDVLAQVRAELGARGANEVEGLLLEWLKGALNPAQDAATDEKNAATEPPPPSAEETQWALLGAEARLRLDAACYGSLLLFIAGCAQSPAKAARAIKEGTARLARKGK